MKKYLQIIIISLLLYGSVHAQSSDFIAGTSLIFEDKFELDPRGDFPAKWSTSFDGEVVMLDNAAGKWLKISQPTAVSPELKKALPEDCTIEFDVFLKNTGGVAPVIKFGLTPLSDVAAGDVYKKNIFVQLQRYNDSGLIVFGKNIQDLGTKSFASGGYIGRTLRISISINKTRFRVYFDQQKILDMPKLLTPEYRNNFFIASSTVVPASEEAVYISNVRIAAGEADARSLLKKQLTDQEQEVPGAQQNADTNMLSNRSQPSPVIPDSISMEIINSPFLKDSIHLAQDSVIAATGSEKSNNVIEKVNTNSEEKPISDSSDKTTEKKGNIITEIKEKASEVIKKRALDKAKQILTDIIKF